MIFRFECEVKRKEKPIKKRQGGLQEFSKKCLAAMILLWFFGALFGFIVVAVQVVRGDMTVGLSDVLLYIGAPMTGGIVSYMIKSAWEKRKGKLPDLNTDDDNSI